MTFEGVLFCVRMGTSAELGFLEPGFAVVSDSGREPFQGIDGLTIFLDFIFLAKSQDAVEDFPGRMLFRLEILLLRDLDGLLYFFQQLFGGCELSAAGNFGFRFTAGICGIRRG